MLIGQAPGPTEYERNAPFQGDAGVSIRALFSACGLKDFDGIVYQTSVTKCFPGRRPKASSDRKPSAQEIKNCSDFLVRQLDLLRPKLIVCLGELAWKSYGGGLI
jgi:uracil-DNA glycosylase